MKIEASKGDKDASACGLIEAKFVVKGPHFVSLLTILGVNVKEKWTTKNTLTSEFAFDVAQLSSKLTVEAPFSPKDGYVLLVLHFTHHVEQNPFHC